MTTPLMLLLSSINESYGYDHPVDTMYLNRSDRSLLLDEVNRFGHMVMDDANIITTTNAFGEEVCDNVQIINSEVVDVCPLTSIILTRLRECYKVYKQHIKTSQRASVGDEETADLDTDAVILRLEGNPSTIYMHVFKVMSNTTLSYESNLAKLTELYNAIVGFQKGTNYGDKNNFLVNRFELMSKINFWQGLVYHDYMHNNLQKPDIVDVEQIIRTKKELKSMGFYGFVNPLKMYNDFSTARVNRKSVLEISEEVTDFLRRVILSGGVNLNENYPRY